jgi:ABC-type transporter Mla MlaB component
MFDKEITVIDCGDVLGIANVAEMYTRVLSSLAEGHTIQFNVSKIERIDTAAMQMLYAFSKEAGKHDHLVLWQGASEAFVRSAKLLGLATLMNMTDNSI